MVQGRRGSPRVAEGRGPLLSRVEISMSCRGRNVQFHESPGPGPVLPYSLVASDQRSSRTQPLRLSVRYAKACQSRRQGSSARGPAAKAGQGIYAYPHQNPTDDRKLAPAALPTGVSRKLQESLGRHCSLVQRQAFHLTDFYFSATRLSTHRR